MLRRCWQPPADEDETDDSNDDSLFAPSSQDEFPSMIRKVRSLDFRDTSYRPQPKQCCTVSTPPHEHNSDESQYQAASTLREASACFQALRKSRSFCLSPTDDVSEDFETTERRRSSMLTRLFSAQRWSVGYLSVVMLSLLMLSNFALDIVNAQMHRLDSPINYDALSTEVLIPPMRYKSIVGGRRNTRIGLGTAAISSVTSKLYPILPFTGGVDLRREEHWDLKQGWFHTASSMVDNVRDAFGLEPLQLEATTSILSKIPRGGGSASNGAQVKRMSPKRSKNTQHTSTLASPKPFVPVETISKLTLGDLTTLFHYAIELNRADFNKPKFLKDVNDRVKPLLQSMEDAISKSRGKDVEPAKTQTCIKGDCRPEIYGDVDALQFCAAMRLFAEWRIVRQVPEGYKGFAVGMNLGHKDVVQNIAKIEEAVHNWIDHRRELIELQLAYEESCAEGKYKADDCELRSPTLRDLLQHEIDMEVHPKLPRLKDRTAAMGLLWVRRQLHYQTIIFANILKVPKEYPDANAAVSAAYKEVYDQYHGWAVQKIFNYSFQAAPEVEHIYRFMNPHRLQSAMEEARKVVAKALHAEDARKVVVKALHMDKESRDETAAAQEDSELYPDLNPWERLVDSIASLFGSNNARATEELSIRGGGAGDDAVLDEQHDEYITQALTQDAHEHIQVYLEKVQPLLNDLAGLFDDLNMNDPTKV